MNARIKAPPLPAQIDWVNTSEAPTLESLLGRVVVLCFWSYDCVHCLNTLPDLRILENKYHDGLSVIGVHTPKYTHQRTLGPVLKAVNRHYIRYPVGNDKDFLLWQQYGVSAWPTLAVIDAQGMLVGLLSGEGRRQELDALIGQLLDEAAQKDLRVYESSITTVRPEARMPLRFPAKVLATEASLWIADTGNNRVIEANFEGRILRQFGSGNPGYWDGRNRDCGFTEPQGMTLLRDSLYLADTGNHTIRRIRLLGGAVDTVAGTGVLGHDRPNENVEPNKLALSAPMDVVAQNDKIYISLAGQNQITQLDLGRGKLSVLAGSGEFGMDEGEAQRASFAQPGGLAIFGQQLVVADAASSSIRVIRLLDNRVSNLIGAGLYEFGDVSGKRDQARLQNPLGLCSDPRGLVFVADSYNGKIKALNMRSGEMRTLNIPHRFHEPAGLSLAAGALWVANTNAHEIVRVDLTTGKAQRVPVGE